MSKLAIGMIETMGLAAGIEAADICLKAANINLVGYEFAKGSGMTVIKIEDDQSSYFLISKDALCPPKPRELVSAYLISIFTLPFPT